MKSSWLSLFVQSIWRSLTDLNFYVEILNYPLKYSARIVVAFYLILGIVSAAIFSVTTVPKLQSLNRNVFQQITTQLPPEFTLNWDGTKLSSNPPLDITVPYPNELDIPDHPNNFIHIDLKQPPTDSDSLIKIHSEATTLHYVEETNSTPLSQMLGPDQFSYDPEKSRQIFADFESTFQAMISSLSWLSILYFSIGTLLVRLITIAIDALIFQFAFQLMRKQLSYAKVFQLCLHLLVPAEIISRFQSLAFPDLDFPIWSVSFWALSVLLLWHLRNLHIFKIEMRKKEE